MEIEIHITVESQGISKFVDDCYDIGVKPILIETENGVLVGQQVMTSSKTGNINDVEIIVNGLLNKGYNIVRVKVEKRPERIKDAQFLYYETHFRLKLPKLFDRSELIKLCKEQHFHLSKNLFKRDSDFDYQMITYRNSKLSFEEFESVIQKMKYELRWRDIYFDKIEMEECICDSNISVDKSWLTTN